MHAQIPYNQLPSANTGRSRRRKRKMKHILVDIAMRRFFRYNLFIPMRNIERHEDEENGVMIYLADSDMENGPFPGEWEPAPKDWIRELSGFTNHDRSGAYTPYDIRKTENEGSICLAAYPVRDENGQNQAYLVAELSINSVISEIVSYALKVSAVVLALTLLIDFLIAMRMKKTVADPINAIANTAMAYVQDRKNGVDQRDHFSSLGIRTGDELENLTDVMADMEEELNKHEDRIEALLDSLVKALSIAIDERSFWASWLAFFTFCALTSGHYITVLR